MAKRVLGNDPFQRGAAERAPAPAAAPPRPGPEPAQPAERAMESASVPPPAPRRAPAPARPRRPKRPPPLPPAPGAVPGRAPSAVSPSRPEQPVRGAEDIPAEASALDLATAVSVLRGAASAVRASLGSPADVELDAYGGDARLQTALRPLSDFLYTRWFRVSVEGAEHVPTGGALLVANHAGALPIDGPVLHAVLRRNRPDLPDSRWLVEDQVFYAPGLGTLLNRLGGVRASPENATRLLAEGRPVCVFPEGIQGIGKHFRERYRLKRFGRGGFVKLALRTGVPILPVAIVGGEESLPLLAKLPGAFLGIPYLPVMPLGPIPLPAKWSLRIGPPVRVPARAASSAGTPGGTADLAAVEALVEQTRRSIEEMLRDLLRERGGVFSR